MEYNGMNVYGSPEKVSVSYNPEIWNLSRQDKGFLELVVAEAQEGRVEKRHASATDHADNVSH